MEGRLVMLTQARDAEKSDEEKSKLTRDEVRQQEEEEEEGEAERGSNYFVRCGGWKRS